MHQLVRKQLSDNGQEKFTPLMVVEGIDIANKIISECTYGYEIELVEV